MESFTAFIPINRCPSAVLQFLVFILMLITESNFNDQCFLSSYSLQIDEYGKLFSQLIRLKKSKSSCEIRTQWTWEVPRRVSPSQSTSLRLWVYHLLTSFTKTIYSSNSEEVQLLTMEPLPIFDLDGMDTTLISSPKNLFFSGAILSPLSCWGGKSSGLWYEGPSTSWK